MCCMAARISLDFAEHISLGPATGTFYVRSTSENSNMSCIAELIIGLRPADCSLSAYQLLHRVARPFSAVQLLCHLSRTSRLCSNKIAQQIATDFGSSRISKVALLEYPGLTSSWVPQLWTAWTAWTAWVGLLGLEKTSSDGGCPLGDLTTRCYAYDLQMARQELPH